MTIPYLLKCPNPLLNNQTAIFNLHCSPPPVQRVIHSYGNTVNTKRKDIALFVDSIPKGMRMKDINSRIKGGKMHLKSFPDAKASQLNHYTKPTLEDYKYDCAIIHVGINDILRNKNDTDKYDTE